MKEYRRLKSIDGSGTIMRYYDLEDDEAYTNCFYKIASDKATKLSGSGAGADLIGFSHGGNAFIAGKILLDINPGVEYMAILDEEDDRPTIGELVNGYQRVTGIHYDGDAGYVPGEEGAGVEVLDNPYYIFVIEQPAASTTGSITDTDAGTLTPNQKKKAE